MVTRTLVRDLRDFIAFMDKDPRYVTCVDTFYRQKVRKGTFPVAEIG
jgi:hypothetical protein